MVLNLSLGFSGLTDSSGQKWNLLTLLLTNTNSTSSRYALNLVDTIKVEAGKSSLMTDGNKTPKDTLFFLTPDSDEEKQKKAVKKAPSAPLKNGTPMKQKTVGGKVLRNQTRRAVQDEVHQTALAKLIEHQRELHESLQTQGLAKFSEDGGGSSGKEGKGWKKFQSYKGEGALPSEVDRLRVHSIRRFPRFFFTHANLSFFRLWLTVKPRLLFYPSMDLLFLSTSILSRMPAKATKEILHIFASTSRHQVS